MAYYNQCERCGATLDPSERCDCNDNCNDNDIKKKSFISLIEYERRVLGSIRETKIS